LKYPLVDRAKIPCSITLDPKENEFIKERDYLYPYYYGFEQ